MKISAGTIARTIILALALINQVLTATGHGMINIADEDVNLLVSTIFTIVTAIVAWWKNNSFTKAAIEADAIMKEKKDERS
jgi:SPP1 family holin